jgi:pilus assembly protein FimV
LPTDKELTHVKQAEAVSEIRAQADDWNSYRQKLAGAATPSSQAQSTQQVASGKINSSVADKAPIVKESAKEVLKLSKGDMPGDKAVPLVNGKAASAQDKKNAVQEDAIAQAKAVKEGQARTALLDKNLKDMERLAKLKVEAEALAQKTQPAVAPVQAAASNTVAAPSVAKTVVSADKVMPKETKAVTKTVSKP